MNDSPFDFAAHLKPFLTADAPVAVAVSGGPDSMALCHMLAGYGGRAVYAVTVDHGLRPEAAAEAAQVGEWVAGWPGITHAVLMREHDPDAQARLQEEARFDRYALLADYCAVQGIGRLFTAHHMDDQAETLLFRLAKGSGLDGLGAMRARHAYNEKLEIVRPLLDVPKAALVAYCHSHDVPFVDDPSNENERFARVRLRRSYEVLAEEGLSAKRLAVTAARLARARDALDFYAQGLLEKATIEHKSDRIVFDFEALNEAPSETRLRVLLRALALVGGEKEYGPRMERAEDLTGRIFGGEVFKKATLAGCIVCLDRAKGLLVVEKEAG